MTPTVELLLSHMYPWPIGVLVTASAVSLLCGAAGAFALWRAKRLLSALPAMQERVDALANSMTLLTDTTESCFKALSMQLQFVQAQGALGASVGRSRAAGGDAGAEAQTRKTRQRRVVVAAKRGEDVERIAAQEQLAETEVALRLHLDKALGHEESRHGAL